MGPRGNPGPRTVQRSHNQLVPPGFRVVPTSAILGDTAVASFASKKVRVTFGCRRSSCQKHTKLEHGLENSSEFHFAWISG